MIPKIIKKVIEYIKNFFVVCTPDPEQPSDTPKNVSEAALQEMREEEQLLKTFERVFNAVGRIAKKQRKLYKQDPLLELDGDDSKQEKLRGGGRKLFGGTSKNR